MIKKNVFLLASIGLYSIIVIFISCSSTEEQSLRRSYKSLCQAITSNNVSVISDIAPFLLEEKNRQVFQKLQEICNAHPSFIIKMLDSKRAIIQLRDSSHTVFPFELDASGRWLLKETIQQFQKIDFIPAKR